jgi:uncharacterized SAM-binding protein YcdF (DUF218 family)
MTDIGVPVERVTFEDKSRTTFENAAAATELMKPKPDENWLLVTSAYHMPRAMACFRKDGWRVFAAPTDYLTPGFFLFKPEFKLAEHLIQMQIALHEYIGLVAYNLMGKVDSFWPK